MKQAKGKKNSDRTHAVSGRLLFCLCCLAALALPFLGAEIFIQQLAQAIARTPVRESALTRELLRRAHTGGIIQWTLAEQKAGRLNRMLLLRERKWGARFDLALLTQLQKKIAGSTQEGAAGQQQLYILGASESAHQSCYKTECLTYQLCETLPAYQIWNLSSYGADPEENLSILQDLRALTRPALTKQVLPGQALPGQIVLIMNPVFFARAYRKPAPSFPQQLEIALERKLPARLFFGEILEGPASWPYSWISLIGPALWPVTDPGYITRLKPGKPGLERFVFPGHAPDALQNWEDYYRKNMIDMAELWKRAEGLDPNNRSALLAELEQQLAGPGAPVCIISALNRKLLRMAGLLPEYDSFRNKIKTALPACQLTELDSNSFVDLDHWSAAGHRKMALKIRQVLCKKSDC